MVLGAELSYVRIAGVAVLLFSAILLGVGIHHLVATGTCSSTGYSGSFGPVPHCPSGTGWWFAFVFGGIIGCLAGAAMAGNGALIFAGIFAAIGFGALSLAFDSKASSGTQVFGAAFGGIFAVVGLIAWGVILVSAVRSLPSLRPQEVRRGKTKTTSRGGSPPGPTPPPASMGVPSANPAPTTSGSVLTPLNLVPGLQAVRTTASGSALDQLSKLGDLHQRGDLTDEEFASAKAKLLGEL
jgi:putative oligomerization/nucleic acid binding protein